MKSKKKILKFVPCPFYDFSNRSMWPKNTSRVLARQCFEDHLLNKKEDFVLNSNSRFKFLDKLNLDYSNFDFKNNLVKGFWDCFDWDFTQKSSYVKGGNIKHDSKDLFDLGISYKEKSSDKTPMWALVSKCYKRKAKKFYRGYWLDFNYHVYTDFLLKNGEDFNYKKEILFMFRDKGFCSDFSIYFNIILSKMSFSEVPKSLFLEFESLDLAVRSLSKRTLNSLIAKRDKLALLKAKKLEKWREKIRKLKIKRLEREAMLERKEKRKLRKMKARNRRRR